MNLRLLPLLCLGLIASLLSGCAGWVETERKVFHNMFSKDTDRSFAVVPGDTAKRDNLEFNHHAARTSIYLKDLGYRMIKPGETPDLMVFLDYGIAPLSTNKFRRFLSIAIFDQKKKSEGKNPLIYQGEVFSEGTSLNTGKITPILIDTLMRDFPGNIGNSQKFNYPANFDERVYEFNGPEKAR
jgi:hypothetical protein